MFDSSQNDFFDNDGIIKFYPSVKMYLNPCTIYETPGIYTRVTLTTCNIKQRSCNNQNPTITFPIKSIKYVYIRTPAKHCDTKFIRHQVYNVVMSETNVTLTSIL